MQNAECRMENGETEPRKAQKDTKGMFSIIVNCTLSTVNCPSLPLGELSAATPTERAVGYAPLCVPWLLPTERAGRGGNLPPVNIA
ncbi:MAG: hypothetical protein FWH14_01755 [Oscillospiraceae bacterium]|nr:hypothetical protein [Oscillospiraceae bacterium]